MMSKQNRVTQMFYIILIPVILVVVFLNSGLPQIWLTAASCGGERFSAVRYDYYYYSCYNEFIDENSEQLSELGYDENVEDKDQNYDADTTWEEYFRQEAEARISYAVYYNTLAEAAGYSFSEEELSPVETKLLELQADYTAKGISAKNYYKAYYGPGMTASRYQKELTYEVKAAAYADYLKEHTDVGSEEIASYVSEHGMADYKSVNLRLITMSAVPDRFQGEVGEAQLDALTERLSRLSALLEAKPDSAEGLARTYSDGANAQAGGLLTDQTKSSVPEQISDWCFDSTRGVGDTEALVDRENGVAYWVCFLGWGESGAAMEATQAIQAEKAAARESADLSSYPVLRKAIGMTVTG
ncbi:MAG: putative isomerase [Oscillospiraceae bacterium]|nr:putative isomerase [Oscillospiraceae bacterium]